MWFDDLPGGRRVRRPRLTARAAGADVVVLEAPGGYGKTSLAVELAEERGAALVSVTVPEPAEGDDAGLLAAALHRALERGGVPRRGTTLDDALAALAVAPDRQPLVVLLDEAQRAGAAGAAAGLARRLAAEQRCLLVVCGRRVELGWPDGVAVVRLDAAELAFTPDEVAVLLGDHAGADADALAHAVEGWPAAVAMLATGRALPAVGLAARDRVLDALVASLVDSATAEGHASLAVAARLPLVGPSLVDAAAGSGSWRALLDTGVPLAPAPGGWWRLSDPVRRAIERRAPLGVDAAARAEAALVGNGLVAEALHVALAAGRADAALALIEGLGAAQLEHLAPAELRAALWAVGRDVASRHPGARLQLARLLSLMGEIADYEALLDELDREASERRDDALAMAVRAERVCDLARQSQIAEARRLGAEVLGAAVDARTRATCLAGLGLAEASSGDPGSEGRALAQLTESAALYGHLGEPHLQARSLLWRGYWVRYRQGDLDRAVDDLRRSRDLLDPGDRRRANIATFLAEVLVRSGRVDEAADVLTEARRVGRATSDDLTIAYAEWVLAEVAAQRGDAEAVERHLGEAERHRGDWWEHTTGTDFLAAGCEMWRRVGRCDEADRWAVRADGREEGTAPTLSIARALLLAADGDADAAVDAIDALSGNPRVPLIERPRLRLLRALALLRRGDHDRAAAERDAALAEASALGPAALAGLCAYEAITLSNLGTPAPTRPGRPADAAMHVSLLGGLRVRRGEEPLDIPLGQGARLVAVVALARRPLVVDEVIDTLWDDGDVETGRRRLRNLLHRLRERAGDVVVRRGDTIVLSEDAQVDVAAFRSLAADALAAPSGPEAVALLRAALDAYAGELLPEHPYDDALAPDRERLAALQLRLLDRLVEELDLAGDVVGASDARLAAADADPWDEGRLLAAADAAAAAGRPRIAAVLVERARALATELGVGFEELD